MENIIKQGEVKDNIYYLPNIEIDRKKYLKIASHLEFLGGKWKGGKIKGFIFDREIKSIDELLGDNTKKKKELQFFETPKGLANELVELAEIDNYQTILEPSAGRGRIIRAIQEKCSCKIDYCEIDEINRKYLKKINHIELVGNNFLKLKDVNYTRIVANPPFSKNQDIEHIMKMYDLLREDGILVSMSSKHWQISNNKKEKEFKRFIRYTGAEVEEIESGEFKDSGTMVGSLIIKIRKN